jgi:hypothetical protein
VSPQRCHIHAGEELGKIRVCHYPVVELVDSLGDADIRA